jgi:hypothetical protein
MRRRELYGVSPAQNLIGEWRNLLSARHRAEWHRAVPRVRLDAERYGSAAQGFV